MKIYLAHPISGLSYDEVAEYFNKMSEICKGFGLIPLSPMTGKSHLRTEKIFKRDYHYSPVSCNHALSRS